MARDPGFVFKYLEELESLAENVLADKNQIIQLDKRRNTNREALAALHKKVLAPPSSSDKAWVNFGGMFIKVEKNDAKSMLRDDQAELDKTITELRNNLPTKVNRLRDAEGKMAVQGFNLNPLSSNELKNLTY